jgi:hypothetical protein
MNAKELERMLASMDSDATRMAFAQNVLLKQLISAVWFLGFAVIIAGSLA